MQIDNGKVEARVNAEYYEEDNTIRDQLHETLNDRFLAVEFLTHKPYELSMPGVHKRYPDGHKDLFVTVRDAVSVTDATPIDLTIIDEDGNIKADTRRERIEKKRIVTELITKYRQKNPVVASLINSYDAAVRDPDNELIHLYEIREALNEELGGNKSACEILGVSKKEWSDFGYLANNAPLKQGRHRGANVGDLRDATNKELREARAFCTKLILGYLEYLESQ